MVPNLSYFFVIEKLFFIEAAKSNSWLLMWNCPFNERTMNDVKNSSLLEAIQNHRFDDYSTGPDTVIDF